VKTVKFCKKNEEGEKILVFITSVSSLLRSESATMPRHRKASSIIAKLSFSSKSRKDSVGSQSKTSDEELTGESYLTKFSTFSLFDPILT
jgi:hypothetical protein